jgi:predicted TIM-barrel fold metal-dependent hydrolase
MRTFVALLSAICCTSTLAEVDSRHPTDKRPVPVIDIHTHVFNISDVPVRGIIFAQVSDRTVDAVESALDRNMSTEEPAASPLRPSAARFFELATPMTEPPSSAEREVKLTPDERAVFAEFLDLRQPAWQRDFSRQSAAESDGQGPKAPTANLPTDLDRLADVLHQGEFMMETDSAPAGPVFKSANIMKATPAGYARFLYLMLQNRTSIANVLMSDYRSGDLFIAHMMDMDRAYAGRSRTPFERQQEYMSTVTRAFDGKLAHFTAFDPFRDADAAMTTIDAGIAAGAIGVKFYPASGYRAAHNEIPPPPAGPSGALQRWKSRYENRPAETLDATMRRFFADMEGRKIPVFTHCTSKGFQAVEGYGWNASPEYWEAVLKEFPKLRLCFGHAGGYQFWFSQPGADQNETTPEGTRDFQRAWRFGQQVVELCLRYKNVYCEVAYLEELLTPSGADRLAKRLARELPRASTAGPEAGPPWEFGDKIMYGTDWHMLYKEKNRQDYLSACNKIISGIQSAKWQRKFFSGNASVYLQLDKLAADPRFSQKQHSKWADIAAGAAEPVDR